MQKIYIKNNGPVKEFEMEVGKFNLLIGEQATGKSTIAKSVYFFKNIKTKLTDYLTQIYDSNSYNNVMQETTWFDKALKPELKNIFVKLFGYSWDLNPDFYMKYEYADERWIQIRLKRGERLRQYISISYSYTLMNEVKNLQTEVRGLYESKNSMEQASLALANEERRRNHKAIAHRVNTIFCDDKEIYYIPAGRSLLTVMSSNRAMMNSVANVDLITDTFMMLIDDVRKSFINGVKQAHLFFPVANRLFDVKDMSDLIIGIEKGEYFYSAGREFLKIEGSEQPVAINFASSGQQEILWLLNFIYVLMLRQERAFLIIEEPEAHIYPLLQKRIMEFIALFANLDDSGVFITTHSPYVLTVANNLYYAGVLTEEGMEREVYKAVNKNYIIKKGELSAYKLLHIPEQQGGKRYVKLLEEDEREINSALIDDVSLLVNKLYTTLYDIELDHE